MSEFVSIDLYQRYKDAVWELTNARQRHEPGKDIRGLTDREIAARLGLREAEVTEIRCIAEADLIPLASYLGADGVKEQRFREGGSKK